MRESSVDAMRCFGLSSKLSSGTSIVSVFVFFQSFASISSLTAVRIASEDVSVSVTTSSSVIFS